MRIIQFNFFGLKIVINFFSSKSISPYDCFNVLVTDTRNKVSIKGVENMIYWETEDLPVFKLR